MFLDVKELAVRKIRIRKSYAPGTVDYRTGDFRQIEPLEVRATAELVECQILTRSRTRTGDTDEANLATIERWIIGAADLLNRAVRVLDFQEDIWGKKLPTGGLWDK